MEFAAIVIGALSVYGIFFRAVKNVERHMKNQIWTLD